MPEYYKIVSYNNSEMYHYCLGENMAEHRISFNFQEHPESIIGRFVEVKYLFPYLELSVDSKLLPYGEIPHAFKKDVIYG